MQAGAEKCLTMCGTPMETDGGANDGVNIGWGAIPLIGGIIRDETDRVTMNDLANAAILPSPTSRQVWEVTMPRVTAYRPQSVLLRSGGGEPGALPLCRAEGPPANMASVGADEEESVWAKEKREMEERRKKKSQATDNAGGDEVKTKSSTSAAPSTADVEADEQQVRDSIMNLQLDHLNISHEEIDFSEVDGTGGILALLSSCVRAYVLTIVLCCLAIVQTISSSSRRMPS